MPDPTRPWTPAQLAGITTTGQSLLLSAAAGSGKTAVLSERCVYLVCEAKDACEIDQILVLAFNDAAALEMKGRIQKAMQSQLLRTPSERLEKQVALAERANISTLHSFCLRLLKQHFHRVGLDPNFTVLDQDEAGLLRYDVARELFFARYEADDAGTFQTLIDHYGDGNDERLIGQVLKIHGLLTSVLDPAKWRADALNRLLHASQVKLSSSALWQEFLKLVEDDLDLLSVKIATAQSAIQIPSYQAKLSEWQAIPAHWKSILHQHGLDTFAAEAESIDEDLGQSLPRVPASAPGKEAAKKMMDDLKEHLREGFCRAAGLFKEKEWRQSVADTLPSARILLDLVAEFEEKYQHAKSQQRAVDFDDLQRLALQVLSAEDAGPGEKPSDVARTYQKRFRHVLVDEYQDINEVQDAILRLVSRESAAAGTASNLFCVGDVKQSIYRFRLAEPQRFLSRLEALRSGKNTVDGRVIDLQENFRSRAPLLASLNAIYRRLMTKQTAEIDYDATQELKPGAPYPAPTKDQFTGKPIELHVLPARLSGTATEEDADSADFEQDEYEASLVAQRILQLTGRDRESTPMQVMDRVGDGMAPRPIRLGDIVILLRARKFTADRYADILRRWGISAHADSGTGFFESQEIRDMMALLQVLDNPRQDIPLAAVLRGPMGRLSNGAETAEDALARIRLSYNDPNRPIPFHEAVQRYASEQTDTLAHTLRERLATLTRWREMIHQRPVAEVLRSIYDDAGLLAWYAGLPDGDQRAANLEELYRRSAQFGTFAKQGLARFLRFLESLQRDSDLGQPSLEAEGADVVRVMTIHQSKGLEFPVVFLPNLGRKFNRLDSAGAILADRRAYLALHTVDEPRMVQYPSLASRVLKDTIDAQSTAEEIRILYVALTRAKEHLVLVGSASPGSLEAATARWAGHRGSLPTAAVRGAHTMLDWLLPIAAAEGPATIAVTEHSAEEMIKLSKFAGGRENVAEALKPFAAMRPIAGVAPDPAATTVLDRISAVYSHEKATRVAAARSVTSWTKHGPAAVVSLEPEPAEAPPPDFAGGLELPRFLATDVAPKATDLGTFTHLALQHFNFTAAAPAVAEQIESMVKREILAAGQARVIDRESIEWFLQTDLGRRIREHADKLHRELPVYSSALDKDLNSPADPIMLRGRLDGYLALPGGGVVLDYKTDKVTGPALDARAEFYRGQLKAYLEAMSRITQQAVSETYLVFLHPRQIIRV